MRPTTVSVVCNTLNRADALRQLLTALRHQTHPAFEVIVVAGPCTDDTDRVLDQFAGRIKERHCPRANLSMSRNIGIAAASGDIVAFVDDDAIPEHTWLEELCAVYAANPEAAAVGGVVHDHTGYGFQTRFILCDRLGRAEYSDTTPFDQYSFPGSMKYPSLLGCNSSFRRDVLVMLGGFDQEFEYYLDETDVCVRLVDAGWMICQSPGAVVHHKFLPSDVRAEGRVVLNNFPIVKNAIYFSYVNGRDHLRTSEIHAGAAEIAHARRTELAYHRGLGRITDEQMQEAEELIESAIGPGIAAGERGRVRMYDRALEAQHGGRFLPFPTIEREGRRLRLCIVTQTVPPEAPGGIGRYCLDLARELGRRGHDVRVVTTGSDHSTVDFEDGVWVHRIVKESGRPAGAITASAPAGIRANAAAVADEVLRIQSEGAVDLVYAPIWDVEGVELAETTSTLVLMGLMTTMGIALENRPAWRDDPAFMASTGTPVLDLERTMLATAHGLHAISDAIVGEIERVSDVRVDRSGLFTSPLGVLDPWADTGGPPERDADPSAGTPIRVLFVGRFEHRKGIDLVLDALPRVLEADPSVRVELIGRDDILASDGHTYRDRFEREHRDAPWFDRVEMRGEVDDDELTAAYRRADIFVAPSRFESFGLIHVEAMAAGIPVVALDQGATPEVVGRDGAGVLVAPDADTLADALLDLSRDAARRRSVGSAGRRRFEERFTIEAMTDPIEAHLRACTSLRAGSPAVRSEAAQTLLPDHTVGLRLDEHGVELGPLPPGRATVVLWTGVAGSGPEVVVAGAGAGAGAEPHRVPTELDRPGFHHVLLPEGTERTVTIPATRGVAFAALHVVPGPAA